MIQLAERGKCATLTSSMDPVKYPDAVKFEQISYSEVIATHLQVMDTTAVTLCQENGIPIRVFNMLDHSLRAAIFNEPVGTLIAGE